MCQVFIYICQTQMVSTYIHNIKKIVFDRRLAILPGVITIFGLYDNRKKKENSLLCVVNLLLICGIILYVQQFRFFFYVHLYTLHIFIYLYTELKGLCKGHLFFNAIAI